MTPTISEQFQTDINATEKIYFCGLILYLLRYLQYETQWDYGGGVDWLLKMMALACFLFHVALSFPLYKKPVEKFLYFFVLFFLYAVGVNAGFTNNGNMLYECLVVFFLVFGAKNIEFRKIVRIYLIVGGTYCVITVLASLLGIIKNLTDVANTLEEAVGRMDNFYRMSLGYGWSTNMANHVFFILLAYFYYVGRAFNKKEMLAFSLITFSVLYFTGSRLSTFCILLMIVISLCYRRKQGYRFITSKFICYFFIVSVPLFAILAFWATMAYDETDLVWMATDLLFSSRLRLGNDALVEAGIPLLGQYYEMYGSARADGDLYNYIDSSYIQSLVIYGLFYTIFLAAAYVYICGKAYLRKDHFLLYSVFLAGVSGLIAQHFIEMYMNPFLIALFAAHKDSDVIDKGVLHG